MYALGKHVNLFEHCDSNSINQYGCILGQKNAFLSHDNAKIIVSFMVISFSPQSYYYAQHSHWKVLMSYHQLV